VKAAQSVLVNTGIAAGGRAVHTLLGVAVTAVLTRYLGVSQFGTYAALLSFAAILQIITDAGLYLTLSHRIVRDAEREYEYLSQSIGIRILLAVLVFGAGILAVRAVPSYHGYEGAFAVLGVGFTFQSVSQLLMSVYQKYGVVWRATVGDLVGRAFHIASLFLISRGSLSLSSAILAFTIGCLSALLVHYAWAPLSRVFPRSVQWDTWKQLFSASWPLGAMLILNAVYFRIDTVMLSFFRSSAEVGLYGLAYRIIESALFFPYMLGGLLLPRVTAALHEHDIIQAREWIEQALRLLSTVALIGAAVLFAVRRPLLAFFGADFAGAAPLLAILSLAMICMFLGNVFGFTLVAQERSRALLALYGGLVVFNIAVNSVFIPRYGALAAAWSTVATEALSVSIAALLVRSSVPWRLSALLQPITPRTISLLLKRP